jgi:hypothetical protein
MKNRYIILGLAAALLAAGCSPSNDKTKSSSEAVAKQMTKAQDAAHDAVMDLKAYTFEKKDEFVASMQAQLADLDASIEELSAKIDKSSDAVKAEAKPKLAALKEQANALKKQIADVASATPTTWSGIKADSSKAYEALKNGLAQSRQWLADKIEP